MIDKKINNLTYMIKETSKLRIKKSLNLALKEIPLQKNALSIEELEVFSSIYKILSNYLNKLKLFVKGESPQTLINETLIGEFLLVRFLKEIPQIIGTDLKQYGPFSINDIATLPKENVETLLKHQAVTLIKEK